VHRTCHVAAGIGVRAPNGVRAKRLRRARAAEERAAGRADRAR